MPVLQAANEAVHLIEKQYAVMWSNAKKQNRRNSKRQKQ